MNRADELTRELEACAADPTISRHARDLAHETASVITLYRHQIRYLLSELHRIGWTPYPTETTIEAQ